MIIKKIYKKIFYRIFPTESPIETYLKNGRIPWSLGYILYKEKFIENSLRALNIEEKFKSYNLKDGFGVGIDERCIEYPWIFSKLNLGKERLLDAGSTFNFKFILEQDKLKDKELFIYTYYPEGDCFYQKRISYVYGDLRELCFNNEYFDTIISQSTIEHIDMDNSIYGYNNASAINHKSYEYMKAIIEMYRVLKSNGRLLITFPFGKFENHGFFQQFDKEMLERINEYFNEKGKINITYFKYERQGWRFAKQEELLDVCSYNPHTGVGKGDDGAAHCRSIACIEFLKN